METRQKIVRGEWILLGMTGLFLCLLLGLHVYDRAAPAQVETERTALTEDIRPELERINLNAATAEDLMELPGIGEELAARIVEYREANGPFRTVEQLTEVSGIGQGKLAALEGMATVEESE